MAPLPLTADHPLQLPKYLLLSIAAGLMVLHLSLIFRIGDNNQTGTMIVCWSAIAYLIWNKRHHLNLTSGLFASGVGSLLLIVVLVKSAFITQDETFLDFSPFLSALAVGLLASGWRGLKQYWRELIILVFPAIMPALSARLLNLSPFTAKLSTVLLLVSGFPVVNQGVYIFHRGNMVEVNHDCSGLIVLLQLLNMVLIYLVLFPSRRQYWVVLPLIATAIALITNAIRVALLAVLYSPTTKAAFDYWHTGGGSMIFSMIAVLLLGGVIYYWMPVPEESKS